MSSATIGDVYSGLREHGVAECARCLRSRLAAKEQDQQGNQEEDDEE